MSSARWGAPITAGKDLDVRELPSYGFSHRSIMWWGTLGLIAIEGMVFAIAIAAYFYVWSQATRWPLTELAPQLGFATLNVVILLASAIPNEWTKRAAERRDLRAVRIGLFIGVAFGIALIFVRALEFTTLNCRWDSSAYGSVVWLLLGLHTTHLVTDFYDTAVLAVLMSAGPIEGKRYVDVSENALYWYFVVIAWLPIYAIIYWMPRLG